MSKSIALGLLGAGAILLWDFGNARQYPTLEAWLLASGIPLASPSS